MRKFLSVVLVLITVFMMSVTFIPVNANTGVSGDCTWTLDGTVLTVSGNGRMEDSYDSYGNAVFFGYDITEIIITDGVTYIGDWAFAYLENVSSVKIGKDVSQIGSNAFYMCSGISSIMLPDNLLSFGNSAFEKCTSLKRIAIPDSVSKIPDSAFSGCTSLYSVTLGEGVTSVGKSAFSSCSSLSDICLPETLLGVENDAFFDCNELDNVHIYDIAAWCNIKWENDYSNPLYFADNLFLNEEKPENIILPDTVFSLPYRSFSFTSLKSITIPQSVTLIDEAAFAECDSLEKVYYIGSENQYKFIKIENDNDKLKSAKWLYNSCTVGAPHKYGEGCGAECTVCGYVRLDAGHKYTSNCDDTCDACGEKREIIHSFTNPCDSECDVCGFVRKTEHFYKSSSDNICEICGEKRTGNAKSTVVVSFIVFLIIDAVIIFLVIKFRKTKEDVEDIFKL